MRYEVKIGILAVVAILLAFWGFKFIQGSNLFSSSNTYFINYEEVAGLTVGTPVQISGVSVGSVGAIQLDQQSRLVKVTIEVRDEINVPKESQAYITTVSLLGEKALELSYSKPCFGTGDCAENGDYLEGASKGILESFLGSEDGENPADGLKNQLGEVVDSLEWTLFSEESDNPIARSTRDLAVTMENLKATSARLQGIINANAGEINTTMENLETLSNTLAAKEQAIAGIIDNAEEFSGDLSELELDQTMQNINQSIAQLRGTLDEADQALAGVTAVMNDVSSGKGTLGKLLNDDEIYNRLNSATMEADTLFSDFQERPYRYIPFKSRRKVLRQDRKDVEQGVVEH